MNNPQFKKGLFCLTSTGAALAFYSPRTRRTELNSAAGHLAMDSAYGDQGPGEFVRRFLDPNEEALRQRVTENIAQVSSKAITEQQHLSQELKRYYSSTWGTQGHYYVHAQVIEKENAETWASSPMALVDHWHCVPGFVGFLPPDHPLKERFLDPKLTDAQREALIYEFRDELRAQTEIIVLRAQSEGRFIPDGTFSVLGHSLVELQGHCSKTLVDGTVITTVTAKTTEIHGADGIAVHSYSAKDGQVMGMFMGTGKANGVVGDAVNVMFAKHIWEVTVDTNKHYSAWRDYGGPKSLVEYLADKSPKLANHVLSVTQFMESTQAMGIYLRNIMSPYDYGERKGTAAPEGSLMTSTYEAMTHFKLGAPHIAPGDPTTGTTLEHILPKDLESVNRDVYFKQDGWEEDKKGRYGVYENGFRVNPLAAISPSTLLDGHSLARSHPELAKALEKEVDNALRTGISKEDIQSNKQLLREIATKEIANASEPLVTPEDAKALVQNSSEFQCKSRELFVAAQESLGPQILQAVADLPGVSEKLQDGSLRLWHLQDYASNYVKERYVAPASSYTGYSMNAVSIKAEEAWKHKQNPDLKDSIAESRKQATIAADYARSEVKKQMEVLQKAQAADFAREQRKVLDLQTKHEMLRDFERRLKASEYVLTESKDKREDHRALEEKKHWDKLFEKGKVH